MAVVIGDKSSGADRLTLAVFRSCSSFVSGTSSRMPEAVRGAVFIR